MKHAAVAVAAVAVALLCTVGSTAATGKTPRLAAIQSTFPERSYILTLPSGTSLGSRSVTVLENGKQVMDTALTPTGRATGTRFGTVLLLDTSNSMAGRPLQDAYAAARAFAARRNATQRLAVVTFGPGVVTRLPLTTNRRAIDEALANPPATAEGTHLYDAVASATRLLRRSGVTAGSIVLISDGADIGSATSEQEALAQAEQQHVRVFTIGLGSSASGTPVLQEFAAGTGGTFAQVDSSRDLSRIYSQLGYQLATEYLLQYKSFAGPSTPVDVTVTIAGVPGVASASYRSPALPSAPPAAVHRSVIDRVLQSWYTMVLVAVLAAVLVGLAIAAAVRPRETNLRRRLGAFVSVSDPDEEAEPAPRPQGSPSFTERLQRDLELAEIELTATQVMILTAVVTALAVWLIAALSSVVFALFGLLVPVLVRLAIRSRADRQKRLFSEQLPDNLQVLSSAMRSGHSLIGALSSVVEDAPEPSRREFRQVVADEQVGIPLDDALRRVAARMSSRDLEQVALVAALQRETGGNSAEVLDRVAETVRERAALRRLVRTLTAQGRMARWIVSALPVGLLVLISLINGEYMKPMFERTLGQVMVAIAAAMVIAGSLVIRKIIDIKV